MHILDGFNHGIKVWALQTDLDMGDGKVCGCIILEFKVLQKKAEKNADEAKLEI